MIEEKPVFTHDCTRCVFLGRFNDHDLYVCALDGLIDTIIARRGSEGSQYASGVVFGVRKLIPELTKALELALAKGYKLRDIDKEERIEKS